MFDSGSHHVVPQRHWGRSRGSFRSRTLPWLMAILVAIATLATMASPVSEAQAPIPESPTDDQPLEIPKLEVVPVAPVPNTEQQQTKIRSALDGGAPVTDGDPVLDDLLQLIRRRGSVLDGTVLDPSSDFDVPTHDPNARQASDPRAVEDDMAFAAESLLRSARVLSQLGPPDPDRRELITRMRLEAGKLLAP